MQWTTEVQRGGRSSPRSPRSKWEIWDLSRSLIFSRMTLSSCANIPSQCSNTEESPAANSLTLNFSPCHAASHHARLFNTKRFSMEETVQQPLWLSKIWSLPLRYWELRGGDKLMVQPVFLEEQCWEHTEQQFSYPWLLIVRAYARREML